MVILGEVVMTYVAKEEIHDCDYYRIIHFACMIDERPRNGALYLSSMHG